MKNVQLPVSKSLYIRKLIYDFLYNDGIGEIPSDSPEDVRVVHQCLIIISKANFCSAESAMPQRIDVRDCGAAYRFLMAVLAITPGQWLLTGTPRLLQRPIDELVQVLREMGAEIQCCNDCWFIRGKNLRASELTINCNRSGQFASALWLISGKIGLKKLHVLPENPSSAAYISMTQAIMEGKADLNPLHLGEWSAAVYWYARLLLEHQGSFCLSHLDLESIQPDAMLAHCFLEWGVESRQTAEGVVIDLKEKCSVPQEIELDMSQNPDLVPVLACMACLWPKKMVFNGVANLKYKESNRLQIIQEQLSPFATIEINSYNGIPDNQLIINPIDLHSFYSVPSQKFIFNAHNDHRFVMGFSLFTLRGKVKIKDFDCVRKSYPDFKAEGVIAGTDMVG